MLDFVLSFQYYMMAEVIEPRWHTLFNSIRSVNTLDEVLQLHTDCLDTCLKECMLTNPYLLKIVSKLLAVCTSFSAKIMKNGRLLVAELERNEQQPHPQAHVASEKPYLEDILRVDDLFTTCMQELLSALSQVDFFVHLLFLTLIWFFSVCFKRDGVADVEHALTAW